MSKATALWRKLPFHGEWAVASVRCFITFWQETCYRVTSTASIYMTDMRPVTEYSTEYWVQHPSTWLTWDLLRSTASIYMTDMRPVTEYRVQHPSTWLTGDLLRSTEYSIHLHDWHASPWVAQSFSALSVKLLWHTIYTSSNRFIIHQKLIFNCHYLTPPFTLYATSQKELVLSRTSSPKKTQLLVLISVFHALLIVPDGALAHWKVHGRKMRGNETHCGVRGTKWGKSAR